MSANKKKIVIIGARLDGHAGVVLDLIEMREDYELVGFIDNTPELQGTSIAGVPVIGSSDDLGHFDVPADCVHIAIGDNISRSEIYKKFKSCDLEVATLIHPTATVSSKAMISEGCYVGAQTIINNGVVIDTVSIINTGAIIEHDNKIGHSVHMAPGVRTAGRVIVDDYSFVGLGAAILPDVHIGSGAMIGAGATVVQDVEPKTTVIGYAAKKHTKNIYQAVKPDVGNTGVYVAQPTLPEYPLLDEKFRDIANSLMLSNFAKYAQELEDNVQKMLRVNKALSFPNATSALMLGVKVLGLKGEVILPSFTFSATGHAVVWNGLTPVFADIDPETLNIDPDDVERKITDKTVAILAVHTFGNPCDIERLEKIAKEHNLKLVFDSAHALGSLYRGKPIGGFGDLECFSFSGTKVITSAEGGIMTSNDAKLMEKIHLGRNYGASNDYNCEYIGLNGKMSEFHAAIAIESLPLLADFVQKRNQLVAIYKQQLSNLPGIRFQVVAPEDISCYKDFAIIIEREAFGMNRDELIKHLNEQKIFPKRYFYPPLHQMDAYQEIEYRAENLVNTENVSENIVCLPIFSHMSESTVEQICTKIHQIREKQCKTISL